MKAGTLAAAIRLGKYSRRIAAVMLLVVLGATPASAGTLSPGDAATYRAAFHAADSGRWDEAKRLAAQATDRLPSKVIAWMALSRPNPDASFHEIADFIRANPDWPNPGALRRNAELAMPPGMDPAEVRAWFAVHPPLTGAGVIRYTAALMAAGQTGEAAEFIRERWVAGGFGTQEEKEILARFGQLLRPRDHTARLDRLVWDGEEAAAKRLYDLVDPGWRALAAARLHLASMKPGADGVVNRVPASLRNDPGLLYERARWRRRKDLDDGAVQILLDQRPKELGRPGAWWTEMHIMARRAIEKGDYKLAYRLARNHGQSDGVSFAQAEFLAGWLALRFRNDPQTALAHFQALYDGVGSPLSRSRGAYWAGRAAAALKREDEARRWYGLAAQHHTTYYGQLAVERLGGAKQYALPAEPPVPSEAAAAFLRNELVRAVRLMQQAAPDQDRARQFVMRLSANAKTPTEYALVVRLAQEIGRPDLAVHIAKQASQDGAALIDGGYPVMPLSTGNHPESALIHALIRQESTFNQHAVSPAGARGLMQLMPGTAQQVAGQLGLRHTVAKLTTDPDYNVRLGTAYIQDMLDRFNGSYVLAVASYNAGPARVRDWLQTFGDPRAEGVDVVDWIEMIPIYETRNYVQRVMEGVSVYRARMAGGSRPLTIGEDLRR